MDFKNTLTLLNAPVATQEYVRSRGTNLVTNGFGLLGTNYNFSGSVYDPVNLYAGKGSFKYAGDSLVKMTDELIPVDPARSYQLSVWGKATTYVAGAHTYVGIACHDMDGLVIVSQHHMRWAGTDTTLAVALNPGDTTITLTSATNWQGANATAYIRQIVIWNYVSGTGYAYPAYSYSRNVSYNYATYVTNGAWAVGGITGNVIALTAPWPGAAVPAGTAVSNMNSGGVYKYIAEANVVVPTTWTNYAGVIGTLDSSGTNDNTKFSPGTALVKLLFLFNRDVPGNVTNLSAVTFSENAPLTHTHAGVYQPVDADLTAIAALAGTLGLLKKTAADTWALDTSTYLTSAVTSVTGTAPIAVATGTTTPAISISAASGAAAGSMSAADFTKLADVATGATANVGTVTSVGLSLPSILTVTVSPVTTAGTLTATLTSQTAGTVLASPTTGADAAPTFRALEATDIPSLAASKITSGAVALARGGTGADLSATGAGFLKQTSAGATVTVAAVTKSDVGLGNVENTELTTWAGSTNLTTLGTVATGSWHATTIDIAHGGTGMTSIPAFSVHKNGTAQTDFGNNTRTLVTWVTPGAGVVDAFDTTGTAFASNTYTIPVAGYYWFGATIMWDTGGLVDQCRTMIFLYKGATFIKAYEQPMSGTGYMSLSIAAIIEAAAGDVYSIYVLQTSGGTRTIVGYKIDTYWTGYRIIA